MLQKKHPGLFCCLTEGRKIIRKLLIEDLLQKPESVELTVGDKTVELWVRPATGDERTMAASHARDASRKIRKLLNNKKTEEYKQLIKAEVENADKDTLRRIWVNGKLVTRALEIQNKSLEEREYVPEPEGTIIPGKVQDEYEDEVEATEQGREEQVVKAIETAQKELQKESEELPDKDLHAVAIAPLVDTKANQAFETEFVAQLVYRCTFEDEKCELRAFTDVEQVYQLKPKAFTKLTQSHMGLLIDTEEVKNSLAGLNP